MLSDGKDSGQFSLRQRPVSQADVIDRARRDDLMVYGIGMRKPERQSAPIGVGPGGLKGMLLAELPDPGLARVAERRRGYIEIRGGQDLARRSDGVADELHRSTCSRRPPQTRRQAPRRQRESHPGRAQNAGAQKLRRAEDVDGLYGRLIVIPVTLLSPSGS